VLKALALRQQRGRPRTQAESRSTKLELEADGSLHHLIYTPSLFAGVNFIEYAAKFDGKDHKIRGTGLDTVSLKRVDEFDHRARRQARRQSHGNLHYEGLCGSKDPYANDPRDV